MVLVPEHLSLNFALDFSPSTVKMFDLGGRVLKHNLQVARVTSDVEPKLQPDSEMAGEVIIEQTTRTPRMNREMLDSISQVAHETLLRLETFLP
jgi:hypothetical protein